MNMNNVNNLVIAAVGALAVTAFVSMPAWGKSQKESGHASASATTAQMRQSSDAPQTLKAGQHDTKPGPAWKTVGGTVKDVRSDMYVMEDYDGNQMKVHVGQGTKHLRGSKKVGDSIRAEITRGGFANSIQ